MSKDYTREPKFLHWKTTVRNAGCTIRRTEPLHLVHKPNGELLFGLLDTEVVSPEGNRLPRIALIRGDACVIVPLIHNIDTGEQRYLMVYQRRIGNGGLNLEFPAGMLDRRTHDPAAVALQELREEAHLDLEPEAVRSICERPLYTSVGLQDEAIHYFGCIVRFGNREYRSLEGKATGAAHEEEYLHLTLKTREEALGEACSVQVLLGLYLFERALENGSLYMG
jgi:8-oxo-dGTP pyrophosphatase MutT (NUDIX family)